MRLNRLSAVLTFAVLLIGSASIVSAQNAVTTADIQRLQDTIDDASRDVAQMRTRDARLASDLERELSDARDEAIYLKVKLRKNEPVARSEYSSLRDRVEDIRGEARGDVARRRSTTSDSDRRSARVVSSEDAGCSGRNRARRPPADPAQLEDRAGRRSLRSDDDGRPAGRS